jgi:putative hydrolase of the HAD superfamily
MEQTGAEPESSLMIGDDLPVDILGAKDFGMDQIYFNPQGLYHSEKITFEVEALLEIKNIL